MISVSSVCKSVGPSRAITGVSSPPDSALASSERAGPFHLDPRPACAVAETDLQAPGFRQLGREILSKLLKFAAEGAAEVLGHVFAVGHLALGCHEDFDGQFAGLNDGFVAVLQDDDPLDAATGEPGHDLGLD